MDPSADSAADIFDIPRAAALRTTARLTRLRAIVIIAVGSLTMGKLVRGRSVPMRQVVRQAGPWAMFLVGAFFVACAIAGAVRSYSPVPLEDMWDGYVRFYMLVSDGDWAQWFSLAGEHRIVFSRIFFWLDMRYFGGLSILLLCVNGALMILLWSELCLAASVLLRPRKRLIFVTASLLLVPVFSWLQWQNITWGNQTQFFAAYAFPLAAFQCLALSVDSSRPKLWFCASLLCGCVSMGTMGNGILALPMLIAMTAVMRHRARVRLLVLVPITAAMYGLHFHGFASSISTLATWPDGLRFLLVFLGAPFGLIFSNLSVAMIGGVLWIAGGVHLFVTWVRSREREPMFLALLAFLVHVGASAVVAAAVRAGIRAGDPLSSRYLTAVLLGWSALGLLFIAKYRDARELWGAVAVLAAVVPLSFLASQLEAFGDYGPTQARMRWIAALALDLGVRDKETTQVLYHGGNAGFEQTAADARKRNLSVFGLPEMIRMRNAIGHMVSELGLVECQGSIDAGLPIAGEPNAIKVIGWAFDTRRMQVPKEVYLADENGRVVGAALPGDSRLDVTRAVDPRAELSGFTGYVRRHGATGIRVMCAK